jgi:hypothetical protein
MADGGRAGGAYTPTEAAEIERAARRVARLFGTGSGWRAETVILSPGAEDADSDWLVIAHRGYVAEQAARRVGSATTTVRRQHAWTIHSATVAVPAAMRADVQGMAALSYARLTGPLYPLLRAYSCESFADWQQVEPFLWRHCPSRNQLIAGRDAMARTMYRRAAVSMDARARQLKIRAADYRAETASAERVLRGWLLLAARSVNRNPDYRVQAPGASQGNALRLSTFWRPLGRETIPQTA